VDTSGLVFLRARYMQPTLGIFLARDPWRGEPMRPGSVNGFGYGLGNPVKYTDPSGFIAEPWDFRVRLSDAGSPSERDERVVSFQKKYWYYFLEFHGSLGREADFIAWLQNSNRLIEGRAGNWWDVADAYLTASRYAGERVADFLESQQDCPDAYWQLGHLEPGVPEWAALILTIRQIQKDRYLLGPQSSWEMSQISWKAHNTALREGVSRADALGLRKKEPTYERILINWVLYNVLEPGDQCASGNDSFCNLTVPLALNIGVLLAYAKEYPATEQDITTMRSDFAPMWNFLKTGIVPGYGGLRASSEQIHLVDRSVGENGY
jgi:RHS repeat-associated protein